MIFQDKIPNFHNSEHQEMEKNTVTNTRQAWPPHTPYINKWVFFQIEIFT